MPLVMKIMFLAMTMTIIDVIFSIVIISIGLISMMAHAVVVMAEVY